MFNDDGRARQVRDGALYAGLFALALVTRLLYLVFARPPVTNSYWLLADGLLADRSLSIGGTTTTAFEPLYPLFLAASRLFAGDHLLIVRMIQCAVGAVGAVLVCRLASTLTCRVRVGAMAGVAYACSPLLIRYAGDLTDTTLMTVLLMGFTVTFAAAPTPSRSAMAGAWLGLAILTRTMALPLLAIAALLRWRDQDWRAALTFATAAVVFVAPYAIRNYGLNGALLPTRSGINLFIANCEYTGRILPDYGPDILQDYAGSVLQRRATIDGPPSPARQRAEDRVYTRLAIEHMAANPVETIQLRLRNVWYFFSPTLVPSRDPTTGIVFHPRDNGGFSIEHSAPRPVVDRLVYTVSYTPVCLLALVGVWLRRHHVRQDAILWAAVFVFTAVHAIYFPTTHYRAPVEFVGFVYAAVACDAWLRSDRAAGSMSRSVNSDMKSGSETNQPANAVFSTVPSSAVTRCSIWLAIRKTMASPGPMFGTSVTSVFDADSRSWKTPPA